MKKIISLPVVFSFFCFAVMSNRADAQTMDKNPDIVKSKSLSAAMQLTENSNGEVAEIAYVNEVNQRAMHDFKQSFKGVNNEKWYIIKNGYLAEFSLNASKS